VNIPIQDGDAGLIHTALSHPVKLHGIVSVNTTKAVIWRYNTGDNAKTLK
jgi:hypothetical protein